MPNADDLRSPRPASGHPTPEAEERETDPLVDENAQVPLIGNLPDGETAQGTARPGREQADGIGG